MKRFTLALLAAIVAASTATAAVRNKALTFDLQKSRNLRLNHKAYSGLKITGTVEDDGSAVDITGATGTVGFKLNLTDTTFFAEEDIVLSDAANGVFTTRIPQLISYPTAAGTM